MLVFILRPLRFIGFTALELNLVSDQRAPIVNCEVYFLPFEGIGESGTVTVNTSLQPDMGNPGGIVRCGICKK